MAQILNISLRPVCWNPQLKSSRKVELSKAGSLGVCAAKRSKEYQCVLSLQRLCVSTVSTFVQACADGICVCVCVCFFHMFHLKL